MTGLPLVGYRTLVNPLQFGLALHHRWRLPIRRFASRSQSLVCVFMAAAYGLPEPKSLPKFVAGSVGATCAMAFVLDAYFAGVPGAMGRALVQHRRAGVEPVVRYVLLRILESDWMFQIRPS